MIKITYLNPRILIADEGKVLTNGSTYSPVVYLGAEESTDNWQEIDEADVPKVEEESEVEI
ncbi:MAG: hypothetical protein ACI4I7_01400 [Oscillospiraceae bacterium]